MHLAHLHFAPELSKWIRHQKRQTQRYRCAPQLAASVRSWVSWRPRRVATTPKGGPLVESSVRNAALGKSTAKHSRNHCGPLRPDTTAELCAYAVRNR